MTKYIRVVKAIVFTGIWVNASEFLRNEVFLKSFWLEHFQALGMTFPSDKINNIMWVIWGFFFAIAMYWTSKKFSLWPAILLCWFMGFVLMWLVMWNLKVLPIGILTYAVPLSFFEVFVGIFICRKLS